MFSYFLVGPLSVWIDLKRKDPNHEGHSYENKLFHFFYQANEKHLNISLLMKQIFKHNKISTSLFTSNNDPLSFIFMYL